METYIIQGREAFVSRHAGYRGRYVIRDSPEFRRGYHSYVTTEGEWSSRITLFVDEAAAIAVAERYSEPQQPKPKRYHVPMW